MFVIGVVGMALMDKTVTMVAVMASSVVSIITITVSVLMFADSRYALASEVHDDIRELRIRTVEDELFNLESTPESERTAIDRAKIERFKRELSDIKE